MKKLLIITGEYPPHNTGDAAHAFHLNTQLTKRGFDVQVLTSRSHIVSVDNISRSMANWTWNKSYSLQSHIRKTKPDGILMLFNGRMYHDHPMMTFAPTLSKFVAPRIPFVTQFETPGIKVWKSSFVARLGRRVVANVVGNSTVTYPHGTLLRDSDRIISLCRAYEKVLLDECPALTSKSLVIPVPALVSDLVGSRETVRIQGRLKHGFNESDFVFVYFGFVMQGKGIEALLKAFQGVLHRHPQATLILVGGPGDDPFNTDETRSTRMYFERLKALSLTYGLGRSVRWVGSTDVDSIETAEYLGAADAFVLPFACGVRLNNSSFSSVASWKKSVITTQSPLTDDEFRHEENALLATPECAQSIESSMCRVILDKNLRDRLETGISKFFEQSLSWDVAISRTLSAFQ